MIKPIEKIKISRHVRITVINTKLGFKAEYESTGISCCGFWVLVDWVF